MGTYTELYLSCEFKKDLPKDVENVITHLFDDAELECSLPEHIFFECERWPLIGNCSSFYLTPMATSNLKKEQDCYYLTTRSDLKNYSNEIEKFLNWIEPYLYADHDSHLGYIRYEEDDLPDLILIRDNRLVIKKITE